MITHARHRANHPTVYGRLERGKGIIYVGQSANSEVTGTPRVTGSVVFPPFVVPDYALQNIVGGAEGDRVRSAVIPLASRATEIISRAAKAPFRATHVKGVGGIRCGCVLSTGGQWHCSY